MRALAQARKHDEFFELDPNSGIMIRHILTHLALSVTVSADPLSGRACESKLISYMHLIYYHYVLHPIANIIIERICLSTKVQTCNASVDSHQCPFRDRLLCDLRRRRGFLGACQLIQRHG